jgi:hypothetical protein
MCHFQNYQTNVIQNYHATKSYNKSLFFTGLEILNLTLLIDSSYRVEAEEKVELFETSLTNISTHFAFNCMPDLYVTVEKRVQ